MTPRQRVERKLGHPLADDTWSWLERQGYTAEEGYSDADIADIVRTIGASFRRPVPPHLTDDVGIRMVPGADLLHERAQAIAVWMAKAAELDVEVRRFRATRLPHGLLGPEQVHDWVVDLYRRHLPAGWSIGDPELTDDAWWKAFNEARFGEPRVRYSLVHWMAPSDDGWLAGRWPVPSRSPLAKLGEIAERLASRFRWDEHEAAFWVLTGSEPYVRPVSGSSTVGSSFTRDVGSYDVLSRVTIAVDPTVTPEQLAAWWREVRHRMLPRRYRPQQTKALRLARFVAGNDDTTTWEQDRRRWNAAVASERPEWRYDDVANFRRHAKQAVKRLLYVGIEAP